MSHPFTESLRQRGAARVLPACFGLFATLAIAPGCNTVTSQAKNSEGVQLYQQGSYQQATMSFQEAVAAAPDSPDGYYNLAASLHKTGTLYNRPDDLRQAELNYNQCLQRDPNHVECYRGLAVLLKETGRPDASFRLMNNWERASPDNANPHIELARLLEESGQPEQATAQLTEALAADPNNARAFTALARLRDQAGDYRQALANYQRALELNHYQPEVEQRIAQLNAALGVATPGASVQAPTRMVNRWQSSAQY